MDIKISSSSGNFKFRVGAVIKKDDKYLVVKISSNPFYCLVGGHVGINEDTTSAIVREIKEELKMDCKIIGLVSIFENFFTTRKRKHFHELCFVYEVELLNEITTTNFINYEKENGGLLKLDFKWFTLDELKENFKPKSLIPVLEKGVFSHLIIKEKVEHGNV